MLRYVSPSTGKRRDKGLGTCPEIGLAQPRTEALEIRETIASGADPIDQRNAERKRIEALQITPTFEVAAKRVFEDIGPAFRKEKHRKQRINTLATYAFPIIGSTRVDQLVPADIALCLKPIWLTEPETASRVKQRCDRVMTRCVAHGFAQMNPVSSVSALLPKQAGKSDRAVHHPAVPWRDQSRWQNN